MRRIKHILLRRKWSAALIVAAIVGATVFIFRDKPQLLAAITVTRGSITETVSVTGATEPVEAVNLAFERTGTVARTAVAIGDIVKAGQTLVELDRGELAAAFAQAEAATLVEAEKLKELQGGTRPEQVTIQESKAATAATSFEESKKNLVNAILDAYTDSDDAVRSKMDRFMTAPRSASPQIAFAIPEQALEIDIETRRAIAESMFADWAASLATLSSTGPLRAYGAAAKNNLGDIKTMLDKTAIALSTVSPTANLSQSTLDGYRTDISTARASVSSALGTLANAEEKYLTAEANLLVAENELKLARSGAPGEQIAAQTARLAQAQAELQAATVQLRKATLRAPIEGTVTKQEARVGEIVPAGATLVTIISAHNLEIEANIPEVDVGKVAVGNAVSITVDALPGAALSGTVAYIDPAETIVDGVVNFKINVAFTTLDARLKSGMTANLALQTERKENVLLLPQFALIEKDDGVFVRRINPSGTTDEVTVTVGVRSQDGMVEIVSGVSEGDRVVNIGVRERE